MILSYSILAVLILGLGIGTGAAVLACKGLRADPHNKLMLLQFAVQAPDEEGYLGSLLQPTDARQPNATRVRASSR